jgi:hypothetical protein
MAGSFLYRVATKVRFRRSDRGSFGDFMQTLPYDLRSALRQLRKTPGLTLLAILSLTLGIGANTAIFTVIESVLLPPPPGSTIAMSVLSQSSWNIQRATRKTSA